MFQVALLRITSGEIGQCIRCLPSTCPSVHLKMSCLSYQILVPSPWTVHAFYTVIVIYFNKVEILPEK